MQEGLLPGPLMTAAFATMTLLVGVTLAPSGRATAMPRWRAAADEPSAAEPATSWGDVAVLGLLALGLAVVATAVVLRAGHGL